MRVKTFCLGMAAVLALLSLPAAALAQSSMGTVSGTVTDAAGAVVPGASVTLVNQETNVHAARVTNDDGYYAFVNVRPGTYTLTIELTGFATAKAAGFVVGVNETLARNVALKVGAVEENVEVTAQSELLQTSTSELGNVIEEKVIKDMPLQGRNFTQLLVLTPGVNPGLDRPGAGGERRRLDGDQQLRGQHRDPGRLLHERLDPGAAEPLEDLLRRRDREHQRARRQLRGAAGRRLDPGVQGPVARRQGRVRRGHGRAS